MQMQADERSLIEQAKQQDEHAFWTLIQRYRSMILAIIRQYIHNIVGYEEDDLRQQIFLAAYEILPRFRGDEVSFQCWLRRSTKGMCLNILKKQRAHKIVELDSICSQSLEQALPHLSPSPESELHHKEIATAVWQAIQKLPEHYRKVVLLKDIEGLRYHEIAKTLRIEEGTVKSQLSRARKLLRQTLRDVR